MIETGALSQLHLETVYYACQRHEIMLENGYRGGFFLGDGAGVGKGRQIAAIIVENYLRGNKKAVWISVSNDLYFDAKRDFKDLGYESMKVYDFKNNKNLDKIKEGVLFLTYMLLISKSYIYIIYIYYSGKHNRLEEIIEWFGKDYSGVIIFDECHKAKTKDSKVYYITYLLSNNIIYLYIIDK